MSANHLILLASNPPAADWTRRLFACGERPTVAVCADEAQRMLRLRPHRVMLLVLPLGTTSPDRLLADFSTHHPNVRYILAGRVPASGAVQRPEVIFTLPESCSDTHLRLALAVTSEPLESDSGETEPLWDSTVVSEPPTLKDWSVAGLAAHWEAIPGAHLHDKTRVLVQLCTHLQRLPMSLEQAWPAVQYLAPRVRAVIRRTKVRRPRGDHPSPGRSASARLTHAWAGMLERLQTALEEAVTGHHEYAEARFWVALQLLRTYRAAVLAEWCGGHAAREGQWRAIHRAHRAVRQRLTAVATTPPLRSALATLDTLYREILIIGVLSVRDPGARLRGQLAERLGTWAEQTVWCDGGCGNRQPSGWVVDTHGDAPPGYQPEAQSSAARSASDGVIYHLDLPAELASLCDAIPDSTQSLQ